MDQTFLQENKNPRGRFKQSLGEIKRRSFLEQIDTDIRTMREAGSPTGAPSPIDFAKQVIGKLMIAPQDIKDLPKVIKEMPQAAQSLLSDPVGAGRAALLNPPSPSTIASMGIPTGALATYRNTVPLHMRTYLHHMSGVKTPFTKVTGKEREFIKERASLKIGGRLARARDVAETRKSYAENARGLREMSTDALLESAYRLPKTHYTAILRRMHKHNENVQKQLDAMGIKGPLTASQSAKLGRDFKRRYGIELDFYRDIERFISDLPDAEKLVYANKIRDALLRKNKRNMNITLEDRYSHLSLNEPQKNARAAYIKASGGKEPKGFYSDYLAMTGDKHEPDLMQAFGKVYVEPTMKDGEIVPKAIHDSYKFYPEYYNYDKGEIRNKFLRRFPQDLMRIPEKVRLANKITPMTFREMYEHTKALTQDAINTHIKSYWGEFLRKAAFNRPTTIIDIPLDRPGRMNDFDRLALIMGAHTGTRNERKQK